MTLNILIVCVTVLAVVAIAARALNDRTARRAQLQREVAMHERAQLQPTRELAVAVRELTAAAAALEHAAREHGPSLVGQRVTVHIRKPDDQTLYGVVVGDYADRLVLEDAEYVTTSSRHPLPGRPTIERDRISWIDAQGVVASPEPDEKA